MRTVVLATMMSLLLVPAGLSATQAQAAQNQVEQDHVAPAGAPGSFADLADRLLPAVVNISSTQKVRQTPTEGLDGLENMPQFEFPPGSPFEDFFERFMDRRGNDFPAVPQASLGSGFVIDAENGYIITNNHVIRDSDEVRVTFHDDETIEAEVIGRDEKTDIAVLKVETDKELSAVTFGDSDVLRVGDWIVAIGNPFGLGGTVTAGIISARQRDIQSGPYDDYLQTDASINRGNSGGPMFNLAGEVIGINTAIFSPTGGSVGIGFAIPSSLAKPVINQIIKYGRTRRGWLGVRIQHVTDEIAESLGLKDNVGALVASVTEDGPAEDAGIKTGDIILEFNGQDVDEMRNLPRLVAETEIDSKAEVILWRDGKKKKTSVKIGELEKAEEDGLIETAGNETAPETTTGTLVKSLGVYLKNMTNPLRTMYQIPEDVHGVVVSDVEANSEAFKKGLSEGDVIVEINQNAVRSAEDAQEATEKAKKEKKPSILLLVNRGGDVRFVALKLESDKKEKKD